MDELIKAIGESLKDGNIGQQLVSGAYDSYDIMSEKDLQARQERMRLRAMAANAQQFQQQFTPPPAPVQPPSLQLPTLPPSINFGGFGGFG